MQQTLARYVTSESYSLAELDSLKNGVPCSFCAQDMLLAATSRPQDSSQRLDSKGRPIDVHLSGMFENIEKTLKEHFEDDDWEEAPAFVSLLRREEEFKVVLEGTVASPRPEYSQVEIKLVPLLGLEAASFTCKYGHCVRPESGTQSGRTVSGRVTSLGHVACKHISTIGALRRAGAFQRSSPLTDDSNLAQVRVNYIPVQNVAYCTTLWPLVLIRTKWCVLVWSLLDSRFAFETQFEQIVGQLFREERLLESVLQYYANIKLSHDDLLEALGCILMHNRTEINGRICSEWNIKTTENDEQRDRTQISKFLAKHRLMLEKKFGSVTSLQRIIYPASYQGLVKNLSPVVIDILDQRVEPRKQQGQRMPARNVLSGFALKQQFASKQVTNFKSSSELSAISVTVASEPIPVEDQSDMETFLIDMGIKVNFTSGRYGCFDVRVGDFVAYCTDTVPTAENFIQIGRVMWIRKGRETVEGEFRDNGWRFHVTPLLRASQCWLDEGESDAPRKLVLAHYTDDRELFFQDPLAPIVKHFSTVKPESHLKLKSLCCELKAWYIFGPVSVKVLLPESHDEWKIGKSTTQPPLEHNRRERGEFFARKRFCRTLGRMTDLTPADTGIPSGEVCTSCSAFAEILKFVPIDGRLRIAPRVSDKRKRVSESSIESITIVLPMSASCQISPTLLSVGDAVILDCRAQLEGLLPDRRIFKRESHDIENRTDFVRYPFMRTGKNSISDIHRQFDKQTVEPFEVGRVIEIVEGHIDNSGDDNPEIFFRVKFFCRPNDLHFGRHNSLSRVSDRGMLISTEYEAKVRCDQVIAIACVDFLAPTPGERELLQSPLNTFPSEDVRASGLNDGIADLPTDLTRSIPAFRLGIADDTRLTDFAQFYAEVRRNPLSPFFHDVPSFDMQPVFYYSFAYDGERLHTVTHRNEDCAAGHDSRKLKRPRITSTEFYCGAGGLAAGLKVAQIKTKLAVDSDEPSVNSFERNFGPGVAINEVCAHLLEPALLATLVRTDLVCGGPPCQGFSSLNQHAYLDSAEEKRNEMLVFASLVDALRPRFVLFENVRSLANDDSHALQMLLAIFHKIGFNWCYGVLNAAGVGVPQIRRRLFVIASAPGEKLPSFPRNQAAFYDRPARKSALTLMFDMRRECRNRGLFPITTVDDAIADLPTQTNSGQCPSELLPPVSEFARRVRWNDKNKQFIVESGIHISTCSEETLGVDAERIKLLPRVASCNWRDLPNISTISTGGALHQLPLEQDDKGRMRIKGCNCLRSGAKSKSASRERCCSTDATGHNYTIPRWLAHKFLMGDTKNESCYGRLDAFGLFGTTTTIMKPGNLQGRVVHPHCDRILSVHECARSQGFLDSHIFSGTREEQMKQIGNAVAPPVAAALGRAIMNAAIATG